MLQPARSRGAAERWGPCWERGHGVGAASWHDFIRFTREETLTSGTPEWALAFRVWRQAAQVTALRIWDGIGYKPKVAEEP